MKTTVLSICILLSLFLAAVGQQDKGAKLSGFVEIDHFSYTESKEDKINSRNQALLFLKYQNSINESSGFFSSVEFRDDLSDLARRRVYLDEAYVSSKLGNFDLILGKQIITWGKADALNPTNNINPIDYSDLLDTDNETIGILAINANYYFNSFKLQGIYVPIFTSSVLMADSSSRWFRKIEIPDFSVPYSINSFTKRPGNHIQSAQYGLALSYSGRGIDLSASYYNGYSNTPSFEQNVRMVSTDSVAIDYIQNYYELQVYGLDFSTTFGKYGLRGEAGYFIPKGLKEDRSYLRYVVGIDRNFSNIIGYNNMFILIQWIQEIADGKKYPNLDLNHLFQESLMGRIAFEIVTSSAITVEGLYNFDTEDYLIRSAIDYDIQDGLNIEFRTDILDGITGNDGFFTLFKDNNRVQLRIKYSF